jgi:PAS domain S-box-containing protein
LHVDDDADFVDLTVRYLERANERFEIRTEHSAQAGLDRLEAERIDCIVSDYEMPGQDGLEFLETVRDRNQGLPFILFTGKGSEEVAADAITAGVTDYLQKETCSEQYALLANKIEQAVERARAERARERQRAAIETASEGLSILDENGTFIYLNQACADLYGYDPAAMVDEHWSLIYPDDEVEFARTEILPTVEREGVWHGESVGQRADGSTFPKNHNVAQTGNGYLAFSARDLSESKTVKRERRRFKQAVEAAGHAVYMTDADGTIEYVNPAFEEITGYSAAEAIGADSSLLQSGRQDDAFYEELWETITDGEIWAEELQDRRKSGELYCAAQTIAPLYDHNDDIDGFVAIQRDISDRKADE